jgi:adenosylmethionine-8-amino-7-oxononanoate aminotransferase
VLGQLGDAAKVLAGRRNCSDNRRETGVIVRENAHNIVLAPPLMSRDEADEAVGGVGSVLERLDRSGSIQVRGSRSHD